ncbi:MAG: SDR family NAD(P)-dependent oxidoreductase [Candidatus Gastranaerophilales bacterium]|nr:SDR family NAD(P)-dependent oxidoreductase [Candidatus Gastranaerophilales bacterium]
MDKNILIIGLNSELAQDTIAELKQKNWNIYATSRQVGMMDDKVREFSLDVTNEMNFIHLREKLRDIKFDVILNFAGIAIAGAVEELDELELRKQFDVNFFGLLRIIKYIAPNLAKDGRLINVSSMASYGIFPFLSPYCASKQSADILLNAYSIETNTKVVSIRPGAVATKFWETSIEVNKKTLDKAEGKFKTEKEFLVENANRNSLHATSPIYVAKKIAQIVELKNPKPVYNIGVDAKFAKLTRFLPQGWVNNLVKFALKMRLKKK